MYVIFVIAIAVAVIAVFLKKLLFPHKYEIDDISSDLRIMKTSETDQGVERKAVIQMLARRRNSLQNKKNTNI
ncbi:uncharacterized protein YoxC [Undibacterium sp. GrIS 1.2]|uniref:hypothetical protein n=1 Tax=Undibacterium sp. GrIS 1.2 TaxID=3143933 RepID=UPI00339856C6